jgi:hypothetical protein
MLKLLFPYINSLSILLVVLSRVSIFAVVANPKPTSLGTFSEELGIIHGFPSVP